MLQATDPCQELSEGEAIGVIDRFALQHRLPNGKIRTFFGSDSKLKKLVSEDGVSPDAVDSALRIRDRLSFKGQGERGMYLCHTFCELGATPLTDE